MSASGYYGLAKGVGLCCVAFVGCHGPAWIVKVKRDIGWPAALFGMLATAACLGVTLYGGLGTIASGGADLRAKTSKATSDVERNRATLQRLTAQRTDLDLSPHICRGGESGADFGRHRGAHPSSRMRAKRGPNCRLRETEEATKLEALTAAQTNKALTDRATNLDREIEAVTAKLEQAPAIVNTDPQASTFSQLTGFSVDTQPRSTPSCFRSPSRRLQCSQ